MPMIRPSEPCAHPGHRGNICISLLNNERYKPCLNGIIRSYNVDIWAVIQQMANGVPLSPAGHYWQVNLANWIVTSKAQHANYLELLRKLTEHVPGRTIRIHLRTITYCRIVWKDLGHLRLRKLTISVAGRLYRNS